MMNQDRTTPPRPTSAEVQRMLARQVGLPSRLGYTALLLAGVAGAGLAAALLFTEPDLPTRTRIAFGAMTAIGASWAAFAAWVLARRRVLLAGHRVVASAMAVAFSALFTLGALSLGPAGLESGWIAATAVGATMLVVAVVELVRARRRFHALQQRRRELETAQSGPAVHS